MLRRPRLALPNVPLHLIQRGNNHQACFFADEDYRFYHDWLLVYAGKAGCRIHAYVLMTNHIHLLVSAERGAAPGEMMKALGQRYVQYVNRTYRRSGTLWEGRFRSCPTQAEEYLLACQRYIELISGACADCGTSGELSLVELLGECAGRGKYADHAT